MKSTSTRMAALLGAICFVSSSSPARAGKVEEPFNQVLALTTNGTVRLHNVNGTVRISGWDRAEIEIKAVKRGSRQADVDAVKIEVEAKPDRVAIETRYPKVRWGRSSSASVDYEIKVPAGANLHDVVTVNGAVEIAEVKGTIRGNTVNGRINLKSARSDTRLESVNGEIEAEFEEFGAVETFSAKTINGRIHLKLPAHSDATFSVSTLNGSITPPAGLEAKRHMVGSDLRGNLGKGGGMIRAETINGGIKIECDGIQKARHTVRAPVEKVEEE